MSSQKVTDQAIIHSLNQLLRELFQLDLLYLQDQQIQWQNSQILKKLTKNKKKMIHTPLRWKLQVHNKILILIIKNSNFRDSLPFSIKVISHYTARLIMYLFSNELFDVSENIACILHSCSSFLNYICLYSLA